MNKSTLLQKDLNKKNHHPVIQLNKYNPLGSMLGSHSAKKMQDEQRLPGQSPPACFFRLLIGAIVRASASNFHMFDHCFIASVKSSMLAMT